MPITPIKTTIKKMHPKKGFIAPYIRFPWNQNKNLIGKEANIYQVSDSQFIIAIGNEFKPNDSLKSNEKWDNILSDENNRFKLKNEDLKTSTMLIGCRETLVRDRARGLVGYDVALTHSNCQLLDDNELFSKEHNQHLNELTLTFSKKELDEFLNYRVSLVHEKSGKWLIKASKIFWQNTQGNVTKSNIDNLRQFVLTNYRSRDSWGKIFYFSKSFFEYLARTHFDHRFKDFALFIEKPRMRVERKMLTSRIITVEDIENVLKKIACAHMPYEERKRYKALILFLAYSGQRVVTTSRLTLGQFRQALKFDPPVLTVEANQDKIKLQHYVPLHPELIPCLNAIIGRRKDSEIMFKYTGLMRWLQHNPVSLTKTTGNIQLKDLRKFFEQKSDEIGFTDANKNFIMSHGVSSINWTSYKQFLPENVYKRYIECWGSVDIGKEGSNPLNLH